VCCENEGDKPWLNKAEVVGIYRYDRPVIIKCHVYGEDECTEHKMPILYKDAIMSPSCQTLIRRYCTMLLSALSHSPTITIIISSPAYRLLFIQTSSQSIIWCHNYIIQNPIRKLLLSQHSRMCPWLQPILLPYRLRKTRRPFVPRIRFHHVLNGLFVD
jgi:hypothetical protein